MEILKRSLKLYGLCILGSIMSLVLVVTFTMIGSNAFGKQIGYSMQGEIENDKGEIEKTILYQYSYDEGEDLKKQEYIDKGYTLTEIPHKTTTVAWDVIAQICITVMMCVFVYNNLWNLGFKDNNLVKIGEKAEDKLKGLKIGALAAVPSVILLIVLVIGKNTFAKTFTTATFSLLNPHLNRAVYLIAGSNGAYFKDLVLWQIVAIFGLLLIIPIVAYLSYLLGYKSILVSEKLVYKKK